jgi:hypothetical protein
VLFGAKVHIRECVKPVEHPKVDTNRGGARVDEKSSIR